MGWRQLTFCNWPVAPTAIEPLVPNGLTIDTHNGDAWVSVIPFTNVDLRPPWMPEGWGIRLPELNVRTYVVGPDGTPGVYFFSLDAQGVSSVIGARLLHHLPYFYARISLTEQGEALHYRSRRRHPGARAGTFVGSCTPTGEPEPPDTGSLEAFLVDRFRLYTDGYKRDSLRYTAVDHGPWPLQSATVSVAENTMLASAGIPEPAGDPVTFYSPGVDTVASRSRPVGDSVR